MHGSLSDPKSTESVRGVEWIASLVGWADGLMRPLLRVAQYRILRGTVRQLAPQGSLMAPVN